MLFHGVKALLFKKGINVESHRCVLSYFVNEYVKTKEFNPGISRILYNLFDGSDDADYDIKVDFSKEEAVFNHRKAKSFVDECRKILNL
ncbi:MAG: HEPN domain-containing protein [Methanobrevibacter sp.]|nr:HEPN domain-containing protein [Candidatus Methanoflexus mossambicus]